MLHIANLGCIPLHVLAARATHLTHCDFLTLDFDLGSQPLAGAVKLALSLGEILDDIGMAGFPKTSGQTGLHVLVPLGPAIGFDTAKLLAELLGKILEARRGDIATMQRRIDKRGGRIYIDTGQTGPSRTIVAPYSVRAVPHATVSVPLAWGELSISLDPARFTITTVPTRIAEIGDPMAGMRDDRPDVPKGIAAIEKWVRG